MTWSLVEKEDKALVEPLEVEGLPGDDWNDNFLILVTLFLRFVDSLILSLS
jgi:hypothetical protein